MSQQLYDKIASDINAKLGKRPYPVKIDGGWVAQNINSMVGTKQEAYCRNMLIQAGAKRADVDATFAAYKEKHNEAK